MSIKTTQLVPPNPATTRAHSVHLSYDPKNRRLAYASGNSIVIRPLDPTDIDSVPVQFTGHGAHTTTVATFAPNGNYIALGDASGVVKIWDCSVVGASPQDDRDPYAQPMVKSEFPIIAGAIKSIAWDADSTRVIAVGEGKDKFGRCFTWDSGNSIGEIQGHSGVVHAISIKPTRPYRAAGGGEDKAVVFYQGPPFKFDKTLRGLHSNTVRDVKFLPNGTYFASVGLDRTIVVYDGKTGDQTIVHSQAHEGGIFALSWVADDEFITASADSTLRQWKINGDALEGPLHEYVVAAKSLVETQQLGVVATDKWVVSVGFNGVLLYFDLGSGAEPVYQVHGHQRPLTALQVVEDTLYSGSADGRVLQWLLNPRVAPLPREEPATIHANYVVDIVATKSGIVSVGWDDVIKLGLNLVSLPEQPRQAVYDEASNTVYVVGETTLTAFDASTQETKQQVKLPFAATGVAIVPGTLTLLVLDGSANKVTPYTNMEPQTPWAALRAAPVVVRVSPDGQYAAVADLFGKYTVYNIADGSVVTSRWAFHTARVYDAQWSPDSQYLVSGGLDCGLIIYLIGRPAKSLKFPLAHQSGVSGVSWLDYKQGTFVSTGMDGAIKTWQADLSEF